MDEFTDTDEMLLTYARLIMKLVVSICEAGKLHFWAGLGKTAAALNAAYAVRFTVAKQQGDLKAGGMA